MYIQIAYVDPTGRLFLQSCTVTAPCTILQAIHHAQILTQWHDALGTFGDWLTQTHLDDTPNHKDWRVGIFSQKKPLNHLLQDGDRIEIYRPLTQDPMSGRKNKAKINKTNQ